MRPAAGDAVAFKSRCVDYKGANTAAPGADSADDKPRHHQPELAALNVILPAHQTGQRLDLLLRQVHECAIVAS